MSRLLADVQLRSRIAPRRPARRLPRMRRTEPDPSGPAQTRRPAVRRSDRFLAPAPQRWGIVVCPLPDGAGALCVKRVVGLPGECITLTDGDVYADGKIVRKDWPTLAAMAIAVDSGQHRPASGASLSTWRPDGDDSRWRPTDGGFELAPTDGPPGIASADRVDWLTYHHEQIIRQGDNVVRREGPILDDLAYNQDESRELLAVPDAILSCRLQSEGEGELWLRAADGRREFAIRLDLAGRRGEVREGEQVVARFELPASLDFGRSPLVSLALVDCRLQFVVGETPIVDFPYEPSESPPRQPTGQPFSIGASGGPLRVSNWSISRDIYYLPPPGRRVVEARRLGPTEYWLLGDNSAVSADSRTWPADVHITRDSLVGKILRWR